jgi:hypothetical protein
LTRIGEGAEGWFALTDGLVGEGARFTGPWSTLIWKAS